MKVLILTADSNGGYPVPAVKGGAVSTLIERLAAGNNEKQLCDMEILSLYDSDAERKANADYPNIQFRWVKVPRILKLLDKCVFNLVRVVGRHEKAISFRSPFALLYYVFEAKKTADKTDADKIVIENNIPLARVMRKGKFQGEWYYHFHNVPRIDAGCREEFKKTAKFLCVSQFVAEKIAGENSAIGRIAPEKTAVLYNCVDADLFRPIDKNSQKITSLRRKYGIEDNEKVIVFAGRISPEKGVDVVLNALKKLPEHMKAIIVGGTFSNVSFMNDFQKKLYCISEELKGRALFTEYVNQADLPYYYILKNDKVCQVD